MVIIGGTHTSGLFQADPGLKYTEGWNWPFHGKPQKIFCFSVLKLWIIWQIYTLDSAIYSLAVEIYTSDSAIYSLRSPLRGVYAIYGCMRYLWSAHTLWYIFRQGLLIKHIQELTKISYEFISSKYVSLVCRVFNDCSIADCISGFKNATSMMRQEFGKKEPLGLKCITVNPFLQNCTLPDDYMRLLAPN